jgi:opine dehydrogenase
MQTSVEVDVARDAAELCAQAGVLLVAVPVNGHKRVMDALLPALRDGHVVIVSSMGSLSSLYLFERAQALGRQITVASFGTTVLTARRESATQVRVMTRRQAVGVSALPQARVHAMVALCTTLFGAGFEAQAHTLASALGNTNPVAHVPLALFNWTRIERAEPWPQYHYMTPRVAAVIRQLDAERQALARAFGIEVRTMEAHFAQSFGATSEGLANIAAELHAKRGGPPGPTSPDTRYLTEDIPFGLVFCNALGQMAGVPMPATQVMIDAAALVAGQDFRRQNDLIEPLSLAHETVEGLCRRVGASP